MILSCQNISKEFAEKKVLQQVSFHIEDQEKAAIVGINGAGKTTLLRIIVGQMQPDSGTVTLAKDKTLGYLAQNDAVSSENTIYDELLSVKQNLIDIEKEMRRCERDMKNAEGQELEDLMKRYTNLTHSFEMGDGYSYQSELTGVLKGLGFIEEDFSKSISTLSGGQKTRVALGKLLLQKPDLILLDEPTNHLDMNSIAWLETYLLNYKGAVLIVSHDRYFLDRIATKIIEIDQTRAASFRGNYSDYAVKKEQLRIAAWNAYVNQQREIKHQEEVIEKLRSFNREKSIKRAESREKALNKIEVLDKPTQANTDMKLTLTPYRESGKDVLSVEHLSKAFDSQSLFQDVNFEIKRGEHIAIIGDNGTGKTTLLKILNERIPADSGEFTLGANVEIGYYDQEHHVLHPEKTLFQEISDEYPYLTNTEIRNVLAAFLFTGDDVFKLIGELSGGERGRMSLAKLMLGNANFLILDEPTNHLDIASKEILEDALNGYTGTVLYVSHDRYFINRTAHRILELTSGQFINYIGNYDYYLEKRDLLHDNLARQQQQNERSTGMGNSKSSGTAGSPADGSDPSRSASPSYASGTLSASGAPSAVTSAALGQNAPSGALSASQDWKAHKEEQARIRKKENDLKKCEERIAWLEEEIARLDEEMSDPAVATQALKLQDLSKEQEALKKELDEKYQEWEKLAE